MRTRFKRPYTILLLVSVAEFMAMSIWFSFSAIKPLIADQWNITNTDTGLILAAFQTGYILAVPVIGYLTDLFNVRRVFAVSALLAAGLNLAFALLATGMTSALLLRFLVGMAMAGVYTPGIKFLSSWFEPHQRGRAVGIFVGALVAGSASPYLLVSLADAWGWQSLVFVTVGGAVAAALLMGLVVPDADTKELPASRRYNFRILTNKPMTLMNAGYVSHMWELYAMWAWIGPFLVFAFLKQGHSMASANALGGLIAFLIVAVGAPASAFAGILSDKLGRTLVAGLFLVVSGVISLIYGFLALAPLAVIVIIGLIYGFAIVGDSPVFSTGITELAPEENVGAVLGVQSVLGFGITIVSTFLFGVIVDHSGWEMAFLTLGIGALIGPLAMVWLRRLPEAQKLAGGRR
ncbi:MAG: MFS transporter [Candidatus Bipolaricaulia bacterium]